VDDSESELEADPDGVADDVWGGLFSSATNIEIDFGLPLPLLVGDWVLAAVPTGTERRGERRSSLSDDERLSDSVGGMGDPLALAPGACDDLDLERKPAWNLLGLPAERLLMEGSVTDGLESDGESA
jgi:hypothetical protein